MSVPQGFELVESRVISGKGIIKIPPFDDYRYLYLYLDLVRDPKVNFSSSKTNPDRSEYAKITWMRSLRVVREDSMNYEGQVLEWDIDSCGYLASYLVCAFAEVISYLDYLAPFIPAPPLPTSPTDRLYAEPMRSTPEVINVVCRSTSAVKCTLYALKYDIRCDEALATPKLPPDLERPSKVNKDQPLQIADPYTGADDGGNTVPNKIDLPLNPPPPPPSYNLKIIGSSYGGGCIVYPENDVYADLGTKTHNNFSLVVTASGSGVPCGGFYFIVRDNTNSATIYTSPSPGKNLNLVFTQLP